jgi:ABC-type uncharacterized transport system fused permease/ATPase subunit
MLSADALAELQYRRTVSFSIPIRFSDMVDATIDRRDVDGAKLLLSMINLYNYYSLIHITGNDNLTNNEFIRERNILAEQMVDDWMNDRRFRIRSVRVNAACVLGGSKKLCIPQEIAEHIAGFLREN